MSRPILAALAGLVAIGLGLASTHATASRTEQYLESLGRKPVPADVEELATVAAVFRQGVGDERAAPVVRIAQRRTLERVLRVASEPSPATLQAAIDEDAGQPAAKRGQRLRELQRRALQETIAIAPMPSPPVVEFRNVSGAAIAEAQGFVMRYPANALECRMAPNASPVAAGAAGLLECLEVVHPDAAHRLGRAIRDLDPVPKEGFVGTRLRFASPDVTVTPREVTLASKREEAIRRLDIAAPLPVIPTEKTQPPEAARAPKPWWFYPLVLFVGGFVFGVPIGAIAARPRAAARALSVVLPLLVLVFGGAHGIGSMGNVGNTGNLEGQIGMVLGAATGLASIIAAVVLAAAAWAMVSMGLWLGTPLGKVFRKARGRSP